MDASSSKHASLDCDSGSAKRRRTSDNHYSAAAEMAAEGAAEPMEITTPNPTDAQEQAAAAEPLNAAGASLQDQGPVGNQGSSAMDSVLSLPDLLCQIVSKGLSTVDICRLATVCKAWRQASESPEFWTSIQLTDKSINKAQVVSMIARHRNSLRSVNLSYVAVRQLDEVLATALPCLNRLQELVLTLHNGPSGVLRLVTHYLPELRVLKLKGAWLERAGSDTSLGGDAAPAPAPPAGVAAAAAAWAAAHGHGHGHGGGHNLLHAPGVGAIHHGGAGANAGVGGGGGGGAAGGNGQHATAAAQAQAEVVLYHERVEEVQLHNCRARRLRMDRCPNLHTLSLKGSQIPACLLNLPALQALDVTDVTQMPEPVFTAVITKVTTLTSLVCKNFPLTDDGLASICTHLPGLRALSVSGCKSLTLSGLRGAAALRTLDATNCDALAPAQLQPALQSCWAIEEAYFDMCASLSSCTVAAASPLRTLGLRGCRTLASVDVRCAGLTELLVGKFQSGAGCSELRSIKLASEAVTDITWTQLPSLASVQLDCPNLTSLSITDCDSFTDAAVSALSDSQPPPPAPSAPDPAGPAAPSTAQLIAGLDLGAGIDSGGGNNKPGGGSRLRGSGRKAPRDWSWQGAQGGGSPLAVGGGPRTSSAPQQQQQQQPPGHAATLDGPGAGGVDAHRGSHHSGSLDMDNTTGDDSDGPEGGSRRGGGGGRIRPRAGLPAPPRSAAAARAVDNGGSDVDQLAGRAMASCRMDSSGRAAAAAAGRPSVRMLRLSAPVTDAAASPSFLSRNLPALPPPPPPHQRAPSAAAPAPAPATTAAPPTATILMQPAGALQQQQQQQGGGLTGDNSAAEQLQVLLGLPAAAVEQPPPPPPTAAAGQQQHASNSAAHTASLLPSLEQQAADLLMMGSAAAGAAEAGSGSAAAAPGGATHAASAGGGGGVSGAAVAGPSSSRIAKAGPGGGGGGRGFMLGGGVPDLRGPVDKRYQQVRDISATRNRQRGGCHSDSNNDETKLRRRGSVGVVSEEETSGSGPNHLLDSGSDDDARLNFFTRRAPFQPPAATARRTRTYVSGFNVSAPAAAQAAVSQQLAPAAPQASTVAAASASTITKTSTKVADKGKLPRLCTLVLDGCEGLRCVTLAHNTLRTLSMARCREVSALAVRAPVLKELVLKECEQLSSVALEPVGMEVLSLGSCSALQRLQLDGPQLHTLDLKGCGQLTAVHLGNNCASLTHLDAPFCANLTGAALAKAVAPAHGVLPPPLKTLTLSVCTQLGAQGVLALQHLETLTSLDLSYTDVTDLSPLAGCLPQLRTLILASCMMLEPDSVMLLALGKHARRRVLPKLHTLDVSYCPLHEEHVVQLMQQGTGIKSLAMSGVSGVTNSLWTCLLQPPTSVAATTTAPMAAAGSSGHAAAGPSSLSSMEEGDNFAAPASSTYTHRHNSSSPSSGTTPSCSPAATLTTLSLVRCNNLSTLCFGLAPILPATAGIAGAAAPQPMDRTQQAAAMVQALQVWPSKKYCSLVREDAAKAAAALSWRPEPFTVLPKLHTLRLGLSAVQVLALALPGLAHLELNGCARLRALELHCPLLLTLHAQACITLPAASVHNCLPNLPALNLLDVQHTSELRSHTSSPGLLSNLTTAGIGGGGAAGGAGGDDQPEQSITTKRGSDVFARLASTSLRVVQCGPSCSTCRKPQLHL